jgi:hypothetical protein
MGPLGKRGGKLKLHGTAEKSGMDRDWPVVFI